MPAMNTLHDLLVDELKDIHSAEKQLVKAIPKMAKAATSPPLKRALQDHLAVTEEHVARLDKMFDKLGESPRGKKCHGMEGLIEEGSEACEQEGDSDVVDAGIIGAAQRVEHYEIAAYGTARAHAQALGEDEIARMLEQTLNEEAEADRTLSELAEGGINQLAMAGAGEDTESADRSSRPRPGGRRMNR